MTPDEVLRNLCISCGQCCKSNSWSHRSDHGDNSGPEFTARDIGELVEKLKLSGTLYDIITEINKYAGIDPLLPLLVTLTLGVAEAPAQGRCPCLGAIDGSYLCSIYEARPQACKEYFCTVYKALAQWLSSAGKWCDPDNPLRDCASAQKATDAAYKMSPGALAARTDSQAELFPILRENFQPTFRKRL